MNGWLGRRLWAAAGVTLAGIIHWLSGIDIVVSSVLVAAAFILHQLLAAWDDRQPGGFLNPKGNDEQ
jgi:hypothetical protein